MTEGNDDGNNVVNVRAQVMMRDDSTGGWVPMGGGGLSNVSVRKRILKSADRDEGKSEYFIYGKRISDQAVVLSCTIKKDFQYNKVMPTFHHWLTGDHKFGLTFQTAADARAFFDKGVRRAFDDILEGLYDLPIVKPQSLGPGHVLEDAADEGDVFFPVILPVDRDGSRSSSGSATTCSSGSRRTPTSSSPFPTSEHNTAQYPISSEVPLHPAHHMHRHLHHHRQHHFSDISGAGTTTAISTSSISPSSTHSGIATSHSPFTSQQNRHISRLPPLQKHTKQPISVSTSDRGFHSDLDKHHSLHDSHSYVELAKSQPLSPLDHGYNVSPETYKIERHDSISNIKQKHGLELIGMDTTQQLSPKMSGKPWKREHPEKLGKLRCRYCQDLFTDQSNRKGSCDYAPNCMSSTIDKLTCISCAQCMLYHCMSDAEGDYPHHPCDCSAQEGCGRRWLGLTLLSILVPCLWFYLPFRACYRCGMSCGLCGGKHEAS